jgi:glycosyltransferase involved in cell wall biosynthesis
MLVSACLLAYNHAHTLDRAVRSVLAQGYRDFELVVSDDCSTDSTWEVVQQLAARDERIKPIRTPRNLGMAANANFAVSHTQSRYVALLHHDDVYASNLFARWLDVAERHPSVAFVSNAYAHGDSRVDYHPFDERTDGRVALERIIFPSWGCPIWGTALIRRACWDAVGGMRESYGMLADVDLWMRLAARWDIGYVPEPLITLKHERPEDYPEAYVRWSWSRLRLLYEVHGTNRREYFAGAPVRQTLEALKFRWRVSLNEISWVLRAIVRRRWEMLARSGEVANMYELAFARFARESLAALVPRRAE